MIYIMKGSSCCLGSSTKNTKTTISFVEDDCFNFTHLTDTLVTNGSAHFFRSYSL